MAETVEEGNLDDFFAKKDKTKKKVKSKFTTDEIEEKLEKKLKKGKSGKKSDRDRTGNGGSGGVLDVRIGEDDGEWKEVEEETETDLSGLRIQNLQIVQREQEEKERLENALNGENGNDPDSSSSQGPWKQTTQAKPAAPAPMQQPTPPVSTPAESDASSSGPKPAKYVPPGARANARAVAAASAAMKTPVASVGGGRSYKKKKDAPNVDSQEDFPTLGGSAADDLQDFEAVRGGARQVEDQSQQTTKLSIDNKYKALSGSQS